MSAISTVFRARQGIRQHALGGCFGVLLGACLAPGLALAKDDVMSPATPGTAAESDKLFDDKGTSRLGLSRVVVDGQAIYVSRGVADIIDEEGEAQLVEDDRIVCQHLHRTGTNITLRQCRTRIELEELSEETGDRMRDVYRRVFHACAVKRIGAREAVGC